MAGSRTTLTASVAFVNQDNRQTNDSNICSERRKKDSTFSVQLFQFARAGLTALTEFREVFTEFHGLPVCILTCRYRGADTQVAVLVGVVVIQAGIGGFGTRDASVE